MEKLSSMSTFPEQADWGTSKSMDSLEFLWAFKTTRGEYCLCLPFAVSMQNPSNNLLFLDCSVCFLSGYPARTILIAQGVTSPLGSLTLTSTPSHRASRQYLYHDCSTEWPHQVFPPLLAGSSLGNLDPPYFFSLVFRTWDSASLLNQLFWSTYWNLETVIGEAIKITTNILLFSIMLLEMSLKTNNWWWPW